ncbi:MAG: hypothetical protein ACI376_09375 [Candidatus Bruticola sp.]
MENTEHHDEKSKTYSEKKLFLWQLVAAFLFSSLAAVSFLLWIFVSHTASPLNAVSVLPKHNSDYASKINWKLTLPQVLEGMYSLSGDPDLLFDANQAAEIAAVLPLARQLVESGKINNERRGAVFEETKKSFEFENKLPAASGKSMTDCLKNYLWSLLRPNQQAAIYELYVNKRLDNSDEQLTRFLTEFYVDLCQDAGIRNDFTNYGLSPMRERVSQLRMLHWLVGVILLESDPEYAINKKQAILLRAMEEPLRATLAIDFAKVSSTYFPILEAQVRSVLTDKQQERLLELLWEHSVLSLKLNSHSVMRSFDSLLAYHIGHAGFELDINSLLRTPAHVTDEASITVPVSGGAELPLRQAILGIMRVLEPDEKVRLTDKQIESLSRLESEIITCISSINKHEVYERYPEVQAEVIHLLSDEQLQAIEDDLTNPKSHLGFERGGEALILEFTTFLGTRREQSNATVPSARED